MGTRMLASDLVSISLWSAPGIGGMAGLIPGYEILAAASEACGRDGTVQV